MISALFLIAMAFAPAARAQIEVSLKMPFTTAMRCEALPASVMIRNNTGVQIPVGGKDGYELRFDIKSTDGTPVMPSEQRQPVAFVLAPGAETVVTNDLFRCYQLVDAQQVNIAAIVEYAGRSYLSRKAYLDLQDGSELARLQVPNGKRTMVHSLRTLLRGGHEHLFLRVEEEAGGWTYGATDLGTVLRTTPPQFMLDGSGHTHILHRSGPQEFTYHAVAADGTVSKINKFTGDYKVVRMLANSSGEIVVNGMPADKTDRPPMLQATPFRPDLHR
jgi:hypothetical protein